MLRRQEVGRAISPGLPRNGGSDVAASLNDAAPTNHNGGGTVPEREAVHGLLSMNDAPRITVVIPTLNEAENLPHVLPKLPGSVYEVLLVDGGSEDETTDVARRLLPGVRVVEQNGRGKGNALACAFAAATGDIIVMLDADGSAKPEEIEGFVEVLLRGADYAKGSRFLEGGGSADITRFRKLGNRVLCLVANVLYGTRYTDLCYGYNAFWRHCLPHFNVDCDGFEVETLINLRAAKAGLCVVEVPSFEELRIHGKSNLRTVRDGFRVLRTIFRELLPPRPPVQQGDVVPAPARTN